MADGSGASTAREPPASGPRGGLGGFFAVLADRAAWGALGYMLLALVTGVLYFTWVVTGLSLSLGLSVLVLGVPVFVAFVASVRLLSRVEGMLVETLLGVRLPAGPPASAPPARGLARVRGWLSDRRTWTSMLYFVVELPLGVVYFSLFTTLLALSASLFLAPVVQWLADCPVLTLGDARVRLPPWTSLLVSLAGVALLLAAMHLARALGRVQAELARRLLVRA